MNKQALQLIGKVKNRLTAMAEPYDVDDPEQAGMRFALLSMGDMLEAAEAMLSEDDGRAA